MLRSALLILSGNVANSGFLFARNLAVAALIPVEDYGIAATFAVAMAAVEMASSFGLQQQIVQARDGDDPRLQDALTGFQVLRGLGAAVVLFVLAGPLARFLGIPEVIWAYQLLALVPLLNALQHFDIHRLNRDNRFGPLVITNAAPSILSFALVWPLAWALGDWRVMLVALLVHAGAGAILSHLVAERPWRPRIDMALWSRTLRFGWPILLNALVLFLVFQIDKLAVGRVLGMAYLGVFAMGVTLTLTPSLVLARTIQTTLLPRLSAAQDTPGFSGRANGALSISMGAGLAVALSGVLGGWLLAPWLDGTAWAALPVLLGPLALVQGLRIAKTGSTIVALAQGRTGNAVISNLPRLVFLAIGIVTLVQGQGILMLIWLAVLGETLGLALSAALVTLKEGLRWRALPIALFLGGCLGCGFAFLWPPSLMITVLCCAALAADWRKGRSAAT